MQDISETDIHALLAERKQIAAIWSIEDVLDVRPDLTAERAWGVLREVDRHHDAEFGITWQTLEDTADGLFGHAPEIAQDQEAKRMKLSIIALAHHRNGVCGAPFDVVLFKDKGPEGSRKVGILFDEPYHCAILDVTKLAAGDIAFGSNSWRGDDYEPHLRSAVAKTENN